MSLNDGKTGVQGESPFLVFPWRTKAAMGKWESCVWIATFPRGRRRALGVWESHFGDFQGLWGTLEQPVLGFPRFP
jgi:hypothetical protein